MKVAFCFSGELRSVDKTYSTLKSRIMQRFVDYDIFLHTWTDDPDLHKIDIIKKDSNTKNVLVEPRVTFSEMNLNRNKIESVDTQGLLRQLYCLKKCNELKSKYELDNQFKYDIVVRIRPDILPVYHSSIEPNVLSWNMNDYVYTSDHDNHFGYNDRLYFSNSSNMDLLSNRIDNLTDFIAKGGRLHYETFFKFCIDYTNLKVCRTRLLFVLLRNNGQLSTELGNNISDIKLL